jgi:hypothetical protein
LDDHASHIGRFVPSDEERKYGEKNAKDFKGFVWGQIVTAQRRSPDSDTEQNSQARWMKGPPRR